MKINHDMTVGNPTKLILLFSIPLLIGNVFQQLYSMADTVIVGRTIGVEALAAVGSTMAIAFLVLGFVQGLTSGFAVIVAQRFGAGDEKGVRQSVAASAVLSLIALVLITVISTLSARPLLLLMNTQPDIIEDAYTYIVIVFAGLFGSFFYNFISCVVRSLGDSKTPLIFLVIACIVNIILDYLLIVGFSMGVAGAAIATVAAQFISALMCLIYALKRYPILRLKKEDWHFSFAFACEHLRIGLPMAFQFSITAVGVMIIQSALNKLGTTTVAAYTAASRLEDLAGQPLSSLGVTMATFAAQNYGAGKMDRIREGVRKCTKISIIFSIASGIILALFGGVFVELFTGTYEPQVIAQAKTYLYIVVCFLPVLGLLFIHRNVLQGIGSGFVPMMAGVSELVVRCVAAYTLAEVWGYVGICLTNPIAWVAAGLPLAIKYFIEIKKLTAKKIQV